LHTVAEYGAWITLQRLDDEIRNHPTIVGVHARPVGIENPRDFDLHIVLPMVIEKQSLGDFADLHRFADSSIYIVVNRNDFAKRPPCSLSMTPLFSLTWFHLPLPVQPSSGASVTRTI
jgi:hypothetical protein